MDESGGGTSTRRHQYKSGGEARVGDVVIGPVLGIKHTIVGLVMRLHDVGPWDLTVACVTAASEVWTRRRLGNKDLGPSVEADLISGRSSEMTRIG
jgi:hypothetical protein